MRISTITNWAYGITVVLTALSGTAFIMSSSAAIDERAAVEEHLVLDSLAEELALGAEVRTDEARLYVMRGEERNLQAFHAEEKSERRREAAALKLVSQGLKPAEAEALEKIDKVVEDLAKIETAAVETFQNGDRGDAQRLVFGPDHARLHETLLAEVSHFRDLIAARTQAQLEASRSRSDVWSFLAKIMLAVTAALFLAVLYFVLRRRVTMPLMRMVGVVGRLARQDYTVEIPVDRRRDEIGDMNDAIEIFRINGIERERLDAERRADQDTKDLILQMMHRLQACQNQVELADVVARYSPQIFPGIAGGLYFLDEMRATLARAAAWLEPVDASETFPASACWGLRRVRPHASGSGESDVPCQHLHGGNAATLCVPLTAQGEMIGLLYLEGDGAEWSGVNRSRLYLELIAENVGLAIANLQLRDKLIALSVRDPLTGLFNRRFLDETLAQAAASNEMLACLMIDIDFFKRFNDEFGHDAGDVVMQYVGQILRDTIEPDGRAFRFGGEEFTILLPGRTEDEAIAVAENVRQKVSSAALSHAGKMLGIVTVSLGVAGSPNEGSTGTLITRADAALLQAKAEGRNKTLASSRIAAA